MESWFLVAGLGNPGKAYERTRHNVGFLLVEHLAQRWQVGWTLQHAFHAQLAQARRGSIPVLLCQPQTYMNASGQAVAAVARYHRIPIDRMLVIVDDADLPLGQIRMRPAGSSGGHHGLESVIQYMGTGNFPRLRIGIGRQPGAREITQYVLGTFTDTEWELMQRVLDRAANQVECWLDHGLQRAMNLYNGWVNDPPPKSEAT
ncbi:MAG: aminoacyl-tRNA hydrolase [Verrucomicrobiota bacterium]|nr:aminoacyl-tRNA hydrolase [Limisphaera sp.]MDW8381849.1 aminoacyl-tRNA hydrolase [Verrucomicrobiota bacterium]